MSGEAATGSESGSDGDGHGTASATVSAQLRETPATLALLGTFLVVFLGVRVVGARSGYDVVALLAVQSDHLARVWTWVTSVVLHWLPVHLLFNGAFLYWWGRGAERGHGTRVFATVFFATGVGTAVVGTALGGFLTCGWAAFTAGGCHAVAGGASGALLGAVGYTTARMPSFRVQPFPAVETPLWAFTGVWVVVSVLGIVAPIDPLSALFGFQVGHVHHLVGVLLGLALGSVWRPDE